MSEAAEILAKEMQAIVAADRWKGRDLSAAPPEKWSHLRAETQQFWIDTASRILAAIQPADLVQAKDTEIARLRADLEAMTLLKRNYAEMKDAAELREASLLSATEINRKLLLERNSEVARLRAELDAALAGLGPIAELLPDAVAAAEKAMRKFPQPNYVISKWAEETGEVTKDLIHMAEGRQTADKLRGEMVQALAMLHRLLVEGDQVHGLPPVCEAIRALTPPDDMAAKIGGDA